MEFLTLDEIKQQCRVDFDYDDALLTSYGETAEQVIVQYLGRGKTVEDMMESLTDEYGGMPAPVRQAALMLTAMWYQNQVPAKQGNMSIVPYTFDIMIKPYVIL